MFAVIRQFHDGMQACVRLDDKEYSEKIDVGQEKGAGKWEAWGVRKGERHDQETEVWVWSSSS